MRDKQHRVQKAAAEQRLSRLSGRLLHPPDTYHRHMVAYTQTHMYAGAYMFLDFKKHPRITRGGVSKPVNSLAAESCSNREGRHPQCWYFRVQHSDAAQPLSWKPYPQNAQ